MNKLFSSRPIFPSQGISVIRMIVGLFLTYHGWEVFDTATMKGYLAWDQFQNDSGKLMVYSGKIAELTGGILLTVGWLTRWASLLIICTMTYIAFFVGGGKIWYEDQHPFLFVLLAMVFLFNGPGRWSIDYSFYKPSKPH